MNVEIKNPLTVTYTVDKCVFGELNGTHTETFDLSGLTSDDLTQYIAQTLIIKRQGMLRAKGAADADGNLKIKIGKWKVPAPGKRISVDPVSKIADMLSKLSEADKARLLAGLATTEE